MVKQKISVEDSDLRRVVENLRERGLSNSDISDEIEARIDSYLYNDYAMSREVFENLLELYGGKIPHKVVDSSENNINKVPEFEIDKELAELFGIILGDGHLQEKSDRNDERNCSTYFLEITLHEGEEELIKRTEDLLREITEIEPKKYNKEGECLRLVIHSKDAVQKFKNFGLKPGNKKENQVGVPSWIKEDKDFCKSCIKGLIDTDGAIYQDKRKNTSYTRIQFKNYSEELLQDFEQMCSKIEIRIVKGGPHQLQVSRKDISKFKQKIKPIKARQLPT
jgi:intein/homing endonuclease